MNSKEERVKIDANSDLLKSKGFSLIIVNNNGTPIVYDFFDNFTHIELSGLIVELQEHSCALLKEHCRFSTTKEYDEGDYNDSI